MSAAYWADKVKRGNMKFDKIANLAGSVAPTIATALGGPLAGTAATAIAQALE